MKGYTRIGKGAFSKVYRKGTASTVLIKSEDHVKECMALGWFPKTPLFPTIKRVDQATYEMKFYSKVRAPKKQLNARSYELYITLKELFENSWRRNSDDRYDYWRKAFNSLPSKFNKAKQHLLDALDALSNYGSDMCFEISPRNIATTDTGRLVLLDCFFFSSQLIEVQGW